MTAEPASGWNRKHPANVRTSVLPQHHPWTRLGTAELIALVLTLVVAATCLTWALATATAGPTKGECLELWEAGRNSGEVLRAESRDDFIAECLAH
jgi:hypothetical protein